jgi:hypothetical protein
LSQITAFADGSILGPAPDRIDDAPDERDWHRTAS